MSSDLVLAGALWDSGHPATPWPSPGALRRISTRVPQVDPRVLIFSLQAPPAVVRCCPRSAFGSPLGPCARSRPWASLSTFPRQARQELGRAPARCSGTLCAERPPAQPSSPPPAPPGRSAGFRSQEPPVPVSRAKPRANMRSHALVLCTSESGPRHPLLAQGPGRGHTARNREVQKDAVAHFKTKPNY